MSASQIIVGDCREVLATLPAGSIHTCTTSPPYFGLRDYGTATWEGGEPECDHAPEVAPRASRPASGLTGGKATVDVSTIARGDCRRCGAVRTDSQLGLETTPAEYVAALVETFREVRRTLRDDGTLWLNLGDSYAAAKGAAPDGLKPKDLIGIPWAVAFALRADGWYLRSDVIWAKPNPMPESVRDRPTKAHEYVFLLAKAPRYYYDAAAIREAFADARMGNPGTYRKTSETERSGINTDRGDLGFVGAGGGWSGGAARGGRNKRSVWTVAPRPFPGAHFATFPPELIEPCVLAGSPEGGTVLDPFAGAGTTGLVARRHGRDFVGIELNEAYAAMARERIETDKGPKPPPKPRVPRAPKSATLERPTTQAGAMPYLVDLAAELDRLGIAHGESFTLAKAAS
jgi:DNA modification methylase